MNRTLVSLVPTQAILPQMLQVTKSLYRTCLPGEGRGMQHPLRAQGSKPPHVSIRPPF